MTPRKPVGGGEASPGQLAQAKAVLAARSSELADVRAAAGKWQAGLAGVAGGITLFSIVKSRSDIAGLSSYFPALATVLLALGLGLSVAGALCALRAAYGMPHLLATAKVDLYFDDHSAAVAARRYLRAAVWCTVISLASFAGALGVVWLAPQGGGPQLVVIPDQGDRACGSVSSVTATQVVLRTADGLQSFDLRHLRGLAAVRSCP